MVVSNHKIGCFEVQNPLFLILKQPIKKMEQNIILIKVGV
ncbi:hypothetical protein HMPREF0653_02476 [Prevotella disiens JCM 6334 = ATCC 29426]|uniref:Uncharacterized protein n=1 Tax=Prevotella disiens JCM 6334 = ATCC 29426 TaxID=1235811 RepID=A0ABN0NP48_9BACT|nr:hypothetical protein HMPREF0653_02476 [Prevotella disiens JCM 6334 = ATCC 29426]